MILQTEDKTNMVEGTVFFDPADKIYADHFPGNPIVPGSLIVQAFLEAAEKLGIDFPCHQVENFVFREFLHPGKYSLIIEVLPDRLICSLGDSGKIRAAGTIRK